MRLGLHRSNYSGEWDNMGGLVKSLALLSLVDAAKQSKPQKQPARARVNRKRQRTNARKKK